LASIDFCPRNEQQYIRDSQFIKKYLHTKFDVFR
jgi:hypothetical protein